MVFAAFLLNTQQERVNAENKQASWLLASLGNALKCLWGEAVYLLRWPSLTEDSQTGHELISSVYVFLPNAQHNHFNDKDGMCTNQQPPQRGGVVADIVWVESKWLLAFSGIPVTLDTPLTQSPFFRRAAP